MAQYDGLVIKSGIPTIIGTDTLRADRGAHAGLTTTGLAAGDAVQVSGALTLQKAVNTSTSPIIGIYDGVSGSVVKEGVVVATFSGSCPAAGSAVYLSSTTGRLTGTKPTKGILHEVGVVVDAATSKVLLQQKPVIALPDFLGTVLIHGGFNNSAETFSIDSLSGAATGATPYDCRNLHYEGVGLIKLAGPKYFNCGGCDYPNYYGTWNGMYYDGSAWVQTANSMQEMRRAHAMGLCGTGRVLVADGHTYWNPCTTADLYNPSTNTFSAATWGGQRREGPRACSLTYGAMAGKVAVVGGWLDSGYFPTPPNGYLKIVKVFTDDGGSGSWQNLPDLLTAVRAPAVVQLSDGRIMVAGGQENGGGGRATQLYTPGSPNWWEGSWAASGLLNTGRMRYASAIRFAGDKVLAIGPGGGVTAEVWDPGTGLWSYTANNLYASVEYEEAMFLLGDGRIVCTSGSSNKLNVYDPATNTFSYIGNMQQTRTGPGACLL